ncbi:MAG TPA: 4'-phosphopantetheinyl transferase superfamily protein [Flavisolibacter sp.]|nr:4'-phosphopantetheinyl transferase superfamily protein [Flavisolibacter sp.]
MPIFFQQDIKPGTRMAVWKIEETEDFFLRSVPLQREITHPHKRLQHLAGRYLLHYLFPRFPVRLIQVADTRKPFLEDEAYHFSISHCGDYAAVIVSTHQRVGIDVEEVSEKVGRIMHKFLGPDEKAILDSEEGDLQRSTMAWSVKEAVFKWYGKGGVDFREHIRIKSIRQEGKGGFSTAVDFRKEAPQLLFLESLSFPGLFLSYIAT